MLTFKRPDFGNSFSVNNEAHVRKTLGGDTSIVTDLSWPKSHRMSCTISGLSKIEKERFIQFYAAAAGQEIEFVDHENISWRGFIVTPQPQITQYGRDCQYRTTFEFEGVKI